MADYLIQPPWGKIIELSRGKEQSLAIIFVNPHTTKPTEIHRQMTEWFVGLIGSGVIHLANELPKLTNSGEAVTVKPNTPYAIENPVDKALAFLTIVSPPFDPTDVYQVDAL